MPQIVLALDIATITGFAVGPTDLFVPATDLELSAHGGIPQPISGYKRMCKPGADDGTVLMVYEVWLTNMIRDHKPDVLVFEAPYIGGRFNAANRLFKMVGETEKVAKKLGVSLVFSANIGTVRKYFTGKGRGKNRAESKQLTMDACKLRGWSYGGDDEADALSVWEFSCACLTGYLDGGKI